MAEPTDHIGRRIKLKDLQTLLAVVEAGSMAKASRSVGLTQPAISKAITDMEAALGVALLDRFSYGVEVTEPGQRLLVRARTILDEVRQGVAEVTSFNDLSRGTVRIGSVEPVCRFVADAVQTLHARYPRVLYNVDISDTDSIVQALRERRLDVVVTRWRGNTTSKDLVVEPLFASGLAVLADKRHPLMKKRGLALRDLTEQSWALSPPGTFLGRLVSDLFESQGLPLPPAAVQTVSIFMRLNLVAGGQFLTVLPGRMADARMNRTWLGALDVKMPKSDGVIALITLKGRRVTPAVAAYLACCRSLAAA